MEGKSQICLIAAFDPTKRLTVEESLAQPFLAEYYDPADEPTAEKPFQYEVIIRGFSRNFDLSSNIKLSILLPFLVRDWWSADKHTERAGFSWSCQV